MLIFFRIAIYIVIAAFFSLSVVTLSDVFIHSNQFRFYVLTIVLAVIFLGMGIGSMVVYKNFHTLYQYSLKEGAEPAMRKSLAKLLFIFGCMALFISLIAFSLCMALIDRMLSGTALLG